MGIFDKAKDALSQHDDKVDQAVDKAADLADQRTGNQHGEQIDQGADVAKDKLDDYLRGNDPPA
jgi:hypothetical protein